MKLKLVACAFPFYFCSIWNPAIAFTDSFSIADSKKYKTFVRELCAEPSHFDCEGHDVAVSESWLARDSSGNEVLFFKLEIDGKPLMERKIEIKEKLSLGFYRMDGLKPPALFYNRSRGLTGQQRIHYVLFRKGGAPAEIKIQVNSERNNYSFKKQIEIISFHLCK